MKSILFVTESNPDSLLNLVLNELSSHGFSSSFPVRFTKALEFLRIHPSTKVVLIDARAFKLEAYELCKKIKDTYKGLVKVYIFLDESNLNEASRFGLAQAEVEDPSTIKNLAEKLSYEKEKKIFLDENISSIYSLSGGAGSSTLMILLSHFLSEDMKNTLCLDLSHSQSLRRYLALQPRHFLFNRTLETEFNLEKDLDWLDNYISKSELIPRMSYLNLYSNAKDRYKVLEEAADCLENLVSETELSKVRDSINLISKELQGKSYSLFEDIIRLGSKLASNMFFDLGNDLGSPINKQLLNYSKNLIVLFKDEFFISDLYKEEKKHFQTLNLNVLPIICPGASYKNYLKLNEKDWIDILEDYPLVMPYKPEEIMAFTLDKIKIEKSSELYKFVKNLFLRLNIPCSFTQNPNSKRLLKFLELNYA